VHLECLTTPPTFTDDATNLDISASQIVINCFASIGNAASDLQVGYWSGSAWTNTQMQTHLLHPSLAVSWFRLAG
jgi:hypothetical protein